MFCVFSFVWHIVCCGLWFGLWGCLLFGWLLFIILTLLFGCVCMAIFVLFLGVLGCLILYCLLVGLLTFCLLAKVWVNSLVSLAYLVYAFGIYLVVACLLLFVGCFLLWFWELTCSYIDFVFVAIVLMGCLRLFTCVVVLLVCVLVEFGFDLMFVSLKWVYID